MRSPFRDDGVNGYVNSKPLPTKGTKRKWTRRERQQTKRTLRHARLAMWVFMP